MIRVWVRPSQQQAWPLGEGTDVSGLLGNGVEL